MIKVREADVDDIESIRRIAHLGIEESIHTSSGDIIHIDSYTENDDYVKKALDNTNALVLVAEYENKVVGWAIAFVQPQPQNAPFYKDFRRAYIDTIDVLKEARGRGIGAELIKGIEAWAVAKGLDELVLDVYRENEKARKIYAELGYEVIKETRRKVLL